jgi:GNAT superfamily N-acetyltransferase
VSAVDEAGQSGDGLPDENVYRPIQAGEEDAVHALIARVFGAFVGAAYSEEGRREFLNYIQPGALLLRTGKRHLSFVALNRGELAGVIEIRDYQHVSLLFVEARFQRRGIARGLLRYALQQCTRARPDLQQISVNSSPNAAETYEHLGFRRIGVMQVRHGIKYMPMVLASPQLYALLSQ